MMAKMFGFLREEGATYGEKKVYNLLKNNLPKEYTVYVECPILLERELRFPDFIVVTNYGVVVLEVKDWVQVLAADRFKVRIRTRGNQVREEHNPVMAAREFSLLLQDRFRENWKAHADGPLPKIPWGYAAVFPQLGTTFITQLRQALGEEFVLGTGDLQPDLILRYLKYTLPADKLAPLRKQELDFIRSTINPEILIEPPDRPTVILDEDQEQIVVEPIKEVAVPAAQGIKPAVSQLDLLSKHFPRPAAAAPEEEPAEDADLPVEEQNIIRNASIRLVRGIAGSGKTLVLTQRARYLAAKYPEWRILILSFNDRLVENFRAGLKSIHNLEAFTFHGLCSRLLREHLPWKNPTDSGGWLSGHQSDHQIIRELGVDFLEDEIKWIKEMGIRDEEDYRSRKRKGRGGDRRLSERMRAAIYAVLKEYDTYLSHEKIPDWADIPHLVSEGIQLGVIHPEPYDMILIDEAQDFAPVWIQVVRHLLKPETGVLFLADDPSQSIYRFYSWREKGVHVVGRTRHLRIPYRNTFEVYRAAYALIENDPVLQNKLAEEGVIVKPDLESSAMRHGPLPLVERFASPEDEILSIRSRINGLLQNGLDSRQIAVLHRRKAGVKRLEKGLQGLDVHINTFHAYKGLEFNTVFLAGMQENFQFKEASEENTSEERRLVYMAMTRARENLYLSHQGKLPRELNEAVAYMDRLA